MASKCSHKVGFYSTLLDDVDLLKCQTTEKILRTWEWRILKHNTSLRHGVKRKHGWFFHKLKTHSKTLEEFKHILCSRSRYVKAHRPTPTLKFINYRKSFDLSIRVWNLMQHLHIRIYGCASHVATPTWQGQGNLSHWTVVAPRKLTSFDWTGSYLWYA